MPNLYCPICRGVGHHLGCIAYDSDRKLVKDLIIYQCQYCETLYVLKEGSP